MSRKLILIAELAKESGMVETIKGTGGTTRTPAGQIGCNPQECREPIGFFVVPIQPTATKAFEEIRFQHDEPHSRGNALGDEPTEDHRARVAAEKEN